MGRLEDKRALIVGAGQTAGDTLGNGRAMALRFAAEGARVGCVDLDLDSARETVAWIEKSGGSAFAVQADITREADCERLVHESSEALGGIDVLVNNVGIGTGDGGADVLAEEAWDRIFSVNLKGMWLTIKHALPVMRKTGGSIVNISSLAAVATGNMTAYEASKAGVNRLTLNLATVNAAYGIRCNAIMMGFLDTPMAIQSIAKARGIDPQKVREVRNAMVPLGRKMGTAEDTANAALFLASDEARFITGAILPVDGGMGLSLGR